MLRQARGIFILLALVLILLAIPLSRSASIKSAGYSFLAGPISVSRSTAQIVVDLVNFKRNADENRALRRSAVSPGTKVFYSEELGRENARLLKLLDMQQAIPPRIKRLTFARVIGRSSGNWNRAVLIDKGTRHGIRSQMLALSEASVVGKVLETGSSASKVLLITDPNSKIGALVQRTRDHGILYGTASGECRLKYLPVSSVLKAGDVVETAGFGGNFPKGLLIGRIEKVWKEPGQIYQVASVKPDVDMNRLEEVAIASS